MWSQLKVVAKQGAVVGVSSAIADTVCQRMTTDTVDLRRTAAFAATGFFVTGPGGFALFSFAEKVAPGVAVGQILKKMVAMQSAEPLRLSSVFFVTAGVFLWGGGRRDARDATRAGERTLYGKVPGGGGGQGQELGRSPASNTHDTFRENPPLEREDHSLSSSLAGRPRMAEVDFLLATHARGRPPPLQHAIPRAPHVRRRLRLEHLPELGGEQARVIARASCDRAPRERANQ